MRGIALSLLILVSCGRKTHVQTNADSISQDSTRHGLATAQTVPNEKVTYTTSYSDSCVEKVHDLIRSTYPYKIITTTGDSTHLRVSKKKLIIEIDNANDTSLLIKLSVTVSPERHALVDHALSWINIDLKNEHVIESIADSAIPLRFDTALLRRIKSECGNPVAGLESQ